MRVDARVAGDHFGPAPAQPRHLQHAFGRRALAFGTELAPKLIEAHQADFRLFQSRKTEKVPEFLFILALCIGLSGQYDAQPGSGENFGDVVGRGFPRRSQLGDELPANLFYFRGGEFLQSEAFGNLQNGLFFRLRGMPAHGRLWGGDEIEWGRSGVAEALAGAALR